MTELGRGGAGSNQNACKYLAYTIFFGLLIL